MKRVGVAFPDALSLGFIQCATPKRIARRQLGNFPQAFSHVALVNSAMNLCEGAKRRRAASREKGCLRRSFAKRSSLPEHQMGTKG
jgi:hypothetical protein